MTNPNPFASLPGALGARAAAIVAARESAGCNVHFVNDCGEYDRFSFADMERAKRFAAARQAEGRLIFDCEAHAIAHAFSAELRDSVYAPDMAEIRKRNATPEYAGPICASHDFCDANMAMLAAFERIARRDFNADSDSDVSLWNRAWSMAKALYLTA